ncbi:nucleic acid dioxygenase ALKBH1 isoform X2 [Chelonus insularis]|uniref:nucleic acid dioxygenase ALKBH1 isoform X2 n=1 Tax=Chelonus insularis TaxID=460826 RepID=UPI00158A449D|nr:nucleic acid dioxygenase ALKBH1 isoform X2 [Chelonus insularis]
MFKDCFKYYKSRNPPPNLENVLDLDNPDLNKVIKVPNKITELPPADCLGLKPISSWKVYEFVQIPGLIFIKNPFTPAGQRYWITKCLKDYSKKPSKSNIDAHNLLLDNETWWDVCTTDKKRAINLISKLRWATLGYHHNWDTKHYSEDSKSEIPSDFVELSRILAKSVGFMNFNAEAAIINYYQMNSTLAGHIDHSEMNMEAPLISISFGLTAIFLIGGYTIEDPAYPIFLNSGDVVIMSGASRLKYHGVPKILSVTDPIWDDDLEKSPEILNNSNDWYKARRLIAGIRINMNKYICR